MFVFLVNALVLGGSKAVEDAVTLINPMDVDFGNALSEIVL